VSAGCCGVGAGGGGGGANKAVCADSDRSVGTEGS
jgi:hypothetical protein